MFKPDFYIDAIQSAKKQFVNTVVVNEGFKKELCKLIDAQTEFAKGQVTTTLALVDALIKGASTAYTK